ncbi:MAG: ATP synthase F0 subunit B [Bacteroidetes bacterium]|nr:MAG: ATP synthase F0 subunit B [Bacteroidota bacterium]
MEKLINDFSVGLFFWQTLLFLALLFLLRKYAWKPIMEAVDSREKNIEDSLASAEKARAEMERLQSDNQRILAEARAERDGILKEAREIKDKMISDAKAEASEQAAKVIASAKEQINNEKMAAITDLRNQVAEMSIEIAEMVLKRELSDKDKQGAFVKEQLANFKMN